MATTTAGTRSGTVQLLGLLVIIAGAVMAVAGVVTWVVIQNTLADEQITVSEDANYFAGDEVRGPFTAASEAQTIEKHALEASGGQTYAQMPQDDPNRQTVMTASFLRASLFTSVVSFGVAAMAAGLGIVLILIGVALRRLAQAPVAAQP
jgi:ABC-type Fe3+-siderophore transport system permease subunit